MKTKTKMMEGKAVNGLCEWCGDPLTTSATMKIADDEICPNCYWGYRKDREHVKSLWKGVSSR